MLHLPCCRGSCSVGRTSAFRSFSAQSTRCATNPSTFARDASRRGLVPPEINGIRLDKVGIEMVFAMVFAHKLAETVADLGATTVPIGAGAGASSTRERMEPVRQT